MSFDHPSVHLILLGSLLCAACAGNDSPPRLEPEGLVRPSGATAARPAATSGFDGGGALDEADAGDLGDREVRAPKPSTPAPSTSQDAGVDLGPEPDPDTLPRFSFFVTSLAGLRRLSKSQLGFGGDLRYGEAHGLLGADKICTELAESSMPGARAKHWHAFLSAVRGPDGMRANAIDRIGSGPWYDRLGRIVARNRTALIEDRPQGADPAIIEDLPNEFGVPNRKPDPAGEREDNHHMLTGSESDGTLYSAAATCNDWSSTARSAGQPHVGFAWTADNRRDWISQMDEAGCAPGVNIDSEQGPDASNPTVGSGGGYGGFYCLALHE